ncbi:hypothetical protein P8452_60967 [Trifolium repens]|nr:hypothetical protein P8452_60967 [Trifolium repens]
MTRLPISSSYSFFHCNKLFTFFSTLRFSLIPNTRSSLPKLFLFFPSLIASRSFSFCSSTLRSRLFLLFLRAI